MAVTIDITALELATNPPVPGTIMIIENRVVLFSEAKIITLDDPVEYVQVKCVDIVRVEENGKLDGSVTLEGGLANSIILLAKYAQVKLVSQKDMVRIFQWFHDIANSRGLYHAITTVPAEELRGYAKEMARKIYGVDGPGIIAEEWVGRSSKYHRLIVGRVMQYSNGRVNPALVNEIVSDVIKELHPELF